MLPFATIKLRSTGLLLLCLLFLPAGAQVPAPPIDSMIRVIPGLMRSDEPAARILISALDQRAVRENHRHGIIQAAFFNSWLSYRHEAPERSIQKIDSALGKIAGINDDTALVKYYILKGQCYVKLADFGKALAEFNNALRVARKRGDDVSATSTMISIGWAYMESGKPLEAIRFFDEVLRINPGAQYDHRSVLLCNIASCYNMVGDFKKGEQYARQGISIARSRGNHIDLGNGLNILGRSYYMQGRMKEALAMLQEAALTREKISDPSMLASDYLELADLFRKNGQPGKAVLWASKSEALSARLGNNLKLTDAYKALAESYESLGNDAMAARYLKKLLAQKDSVEADRYNRAFAEMQVQFETQKKTTENLRLKKENLEAKLRNSLQQRWLLLLGAVALLLAASGIYVSKLLKSRYQTRLALEQIGEQRQRTIAVMQAEEAERRRIAGELHDGVAQTLAAAALQLAKARSGQASLDRVENLLEQAGTEVRSLSHQMTPELLLHFGLAKTMAQAVNELNDAGPKTRFTLFTHVDGPLHDNLLSLALYRSFQELCTNILKHSEATEATVQLTIDGEEVQLIVEDNGKGFDPATAAAGLGLKNLQSRMAFYEGSVAVDSTPAKGSTIILQVKRPQTNKENGQLG
ncbi:tetratricopeptide repeat protein [Flaviaesturariibacter flavus]|uniref:histidine kinase n=1 Tax=Flaviaesturariibacter flavus TaxID=2502780 RepID=A0A4R1B584_9BACT|nr:tetratricopeptide repeat protein [Flaviaesturariibacter flavus]TCJ12650.1 tetratricopeptide repeat protein [Flaviaesturariibacter flavus]